MNEVRVGCRDGTWCVFVEAIVCLTVSIHPVV